MLTADWIDVLADLPREAIDRAIRERLRSDDRRRPIPGEIRALAKRHLAQRAKRAEPDPFGPVVVPHDELKRRREMAQRIAREYPMLQKANALSAQSIVKAVEATLDLAPGTLGSQQRNAKASRARFLAIGLIRSLIGDMSYPQIGRALGNRDHTTILHAEKRFAALLDHDNGFAELFHDMRARMAG